MIQFLYFLRTWNRSLLLITEIIADWNDRWATETKASSLLTSITTCEFIVMLHTLADVLSYTIILNRSLQKQDLSVDTAAEVVANLKILLQGKRENDKAEFLAIYSKAIETIEKHHIVPVMPRITGTQRNRANTP